MFVHIMIASRTAGSIGRAGNYSVAGTHVTWPANYSHYTSNRLALATVCLGLVLQS